MHLFALDPLGKIISAKQAFKQQNYQCLECRGIVRRRGGTHRIPHFFHLNPPESCRQQGKSLVHLQVQCRLQACLPEKEVQLEYAFKPINRIADVAWLEKKIIFEVQCSFITPQEIKERQRDYRSEGYEVIWILHDSRYNQRRLTGAENFLEDLPHYFTNIDAEGKGWVYDQYQIVTKGIRQKKFSPLKIDPSQPKNFSEKSSLPHLLKNRQSWPLYFIGDAWDQKENYQSLSQFSEKENSQIRSLFSYIKKSYSCFIDFYTFGFRTLLEKICK